jgi:hypothetical protein
MNWRGTFEIESGTWASWLIGPTTVYAQPRRHEWIIAYETGSQQEFENASTGISMARVPSEDSCLFRRFAFAAASNSLTLAPRLGDRSFVVRPQSPVEILAGEEIVFFVGTVLWVAAFASNAGADREQLLLEIPVIRPSDSWFGANTREGELCYASRTRARTQLESSPDFIYRAITPVEVSNLGADSLSIEQLRVPVPSLALHLGSDDKYWTDPVRFERESGDRQAALKISGANYRLPEDGRLLADPRRPIEEGSIVAAFSRLLG